MRRDSFPGMRDRIQTASLLVHTNTATRDLWFHELSAPWDFATVNWDDMPSIASSARIHGAGTGWKAIDVTAALKRALSTSDSSENPDLRCRHIPTVLMASAPS